MSFRPPHPEPRFQIGTDSVRKASQLRFEYREFYDVPRLILVERGNESYLLDSPFDEEVGEYSETFHVYRLPSAIAAKLRGKASWEDATGLGQLIGMIPVTEVEFDPSKRESLADTVFERYGVR